MSTPNARLTWLTKKAVRSDPGGLFFARAMTKIAAIELEGKSWWQHWTTDRVAPTNTCGRCRPVLLRNLVSIENTLWAG